jgi:hypothetical protein
MLLRLATTVGALALAAAAVLSTASAASSPGDSAVSSIANGAVISGTVDWVVTPPKAAVRVEFWANGTLLASDGSAPFSHRLDTTRLALGANLLGRVWLDAKGVRYLPSTNIQVTVVAPVLNTSLPVLVRNTTTYFTSNGAWTGSPTAFAYRWSRCDAAGTCAPIAGATAASHTITAADAGMRLVSEVTASNGAGSAVASSLPSDVLPAAAPAPTSSTTAAGVGTALPARMPLSSGGSTYFVDGASGSDAGQGTSASPWRSINHALATVPLSGSVVRVRPGTYSSSGTAYAIRFSRLGNPANPVTLMADVPGTVTIANGNPSAWTIGAWIVNASGLRVQGLTFRVATTPGINKGADGVLIENSDRIEFTDCVFNETGTIGWIVRGGKANGQTSDDIWLYGNTFRPSGDDPFARVTGTSWTSDQYFGSKGSHWVYAGQYGDTSGNWELEAGSRRLVVANNVFVGSAAGRHVELGPQARSSYVTNNTFYGNKIADRLGWSTGARFAGEGLVVFSNAINTLYRNGLNTIKNNLFVALNGHAAYGSGLSQPGNLVERNLAWNTENGKGYNGDPTDDFEETYDSSILFAEGVGNLRADPAFTAPLRYDYTLGAGSPAIGKADPAYAPTHDRSGRVRDGAPDLGAFER